MNTITIERKFITFQNNNKAVAVFPSANNKVEDIVKTLDIKSYKAVLLIIGGADSLDEKVIPLLTQLFGRGIARAAAEAEAVIVDGGTKAGVIALMGEAVAARSYKTTLIGVAPKSKVIIPGDNTEDIQTERDDKQDKSGKTVTDATERVQLEPNHTHFVIIEGNEWGSETATIFKLLNALTLRTAESGKPNYKTSKLDSGKSTDKIPVLAVLAGGGQTSKDEAVRAVRQNIPLIVVEGSGGLADEISSAWKQKATLLEDPLMAEIVSDGEIHLHSLNNSVKGIERLIIRELGIDKVLTQAWEVFADYDLNARLQQNRFNTLQLAIITIGVIGTALAIIQQVYAPKDPQNNLLPVFLPRDANGNLTPTFPLVWWILYHLLIITPILLTVLITASNRFKQGSKWLLLRAGAESIKREIFRYRARAMDYKDESEKQLSKRVEDITRRTMRTEANLSALVRYNKDKGFPPYMDAARGGDDGFSYLTPDRYVEVRLGDQLNFFQRKSLKLERQLKVLYWLTFVIGGAGTYLAAVNQQVWIALTTAIVAAIGTYLGYRQTENTLTKYNQAATDLSNVKAWWNALSAEEQSLQQNIDSLVEHTEQVLQSELDGWVQQMQNALAELRKGQEPVTEKNEKREPREPALSAGSKPLNKQLQTDETSTNGKHNGDAENLSKNEGALSEESQLSEPNNLKVKFE